MMAGKSGNKFKLVLIVWFDSESIFSEWGRRVVWLRDITILILVSLPIQVWIFGDVWCKVWLAMDVLLWVDACGIITSEVISVLVLFPSRCTASILNLCAISLDRYVAVTRPVTYPSIMSTRRAKSLIAGKMNHALLSHWNLPGAARFPRIMGALFCNLLPPTYWMEGWRRWRGK